MAKDYIEREAILNDIQNFITQIKDIEGSLAYYTFMAMVDKIKSVPAADVAPVIHATWSLESDEEMSDFMFKLVICSVCGKKANHTYPYCPHCGARMDGGNKNE